MARVRVAQHVTIILRDEVGETGVCDRREACGHLIKRWRIVLIACGAVEDGVGVDVGDLRQVADTGGAEGEHDGLLRRCGRVARAQAPSLCASDAGVVYARRVRRACRLHRSAASRLPC